MNTDINSSSPEATKERTLEIVGISITVTVAFHFLFAGHPFGLGFTFFVSLLAIAMIGIAHLRRGARNTWALLFLLPVLFGAATHMLYASETSRTLAFFITFGSLTLFAYWYSRPKIAYKDVISFWPVKLLTDTLWPYPVLGEHLSKVKSDKRLSSILLGIGISIPFLLIFLSLFTSADQLFAKSFNNLFQTAEFGEIVVKTIRDFIVGLFFLSSGFLMLARLNKKVEEKLIKTWDWMNQTALATFLVMLNILFAIFVAFQAAYFFGGDALVKAQGLTYSDYAVSGFFELLFVAGLVFAITWFIYRATNMKNRLSGSLSVVLIALTGVIIVSAMSRLLLYIDMYGLTLSRFWAAYCITLIGLVLTAGAIGIIAKIDYAKLAKIVFLGSLMMTSALLLFNIEGFIAKYNIDMHKADNRKIVDVDYLIYDLSYDAIPKLANFDFDSWQDKPFSTEVFLRRLHSQDDYIKESLQDRWLDASLSHYRALEALENVK